MCHLQARDGLVWVWAEGGPEADKEAASTPKALIPKMATGEVVQFTPWYMRELPYGADVLCENVGAQGRFLSYRQ